MPTLPQSIDNNVIDLKPVGFFISYVEPICSKTYQLSLRRTLVRLVLIPALILAGKNTVDQGGGAHECDACLPSGRQEKVMLLQKQVQ